MKLKDKASRMTSKQYRSGEIDTTDIGNVCEYIELVHTRYEKMKNIEEFKKFNNHLKDNRKAFLKLFGKPHFRCRLEFLFHAWHVEHEGVDLLLLTAVTKGTCIEVINPEPNDGKTIVSFVEWLNEEVEKIENKLNITRN